MHPVYTFITCFAAVFAMVKLCLAAELDEHSFPFFVAWTSAPYLAYCGLAHSRRTRRDDSTVVFIGTAISAGLATLLYGNDLWTVIDARSRGEELLNCAGPLVELGFPLVQWFVAGALCLATRPGHPPKAAALMKPAAPMTDDAL